MNIISALISMHCAQNCMKLSQGGGAGREATVPPIGLKSMQNITFLVLLRPIFAPKIKTPSQRNWGAEVVKDLLLFGPDK